MTAWRRNRLAWLHDAAWARLQAAAGPDDAAILAHWRARQLPLVVARAPVPLAPGDVALGLPAPLRWQRRRLGLVAAREEVERLGDFPALAQVAAARGWSEGVALAQALDALGARATVYGSHGWEVLTGEACVRPGSDLDLHIALPGFEPASAAVARLEAATLPCRLDGEFALADGSAVAWRECAALLRGDVGTVLVKRLDGVTLESLADLRQRARG